MDVKRLSLALHTRARKGVDGMLKTQVGNVLLVQAVTIALEKVSNIHKIQCAVLDITKRQTQMPVVTLDVLRVHLKTHAPETIPFTASRSAMDVQGYTLRCGEIATRGQCASRVSLGFTVLETKPGMHAGHVLQMKLSERSAHRRVTVNA